MEKVGRNGVSVKEVSVKEVAQAVNIKYYQSITIGHERRRRMEA